MTLGPALSVERDIAIQRFLAENGWSNALRHALAADASFRNYERIMCNDKHAILMNAPPPQEDVRPFLQVTRLLVQCGLSVPAVIARDETQGFLLLEDLGDASFTRLLQQSPKREAELYLAATEALIVLRRASQANHASLSDALSPYSMEVYLREAALFSDWFLPQVMGVSEAKQRREEYLTLWRGILEQANLLKHCLVHRDYHADNLFWLAARAGHQAVGMLDYQDALWGDSAYDLASLLEDARRDVAPTTVAACIAHYVKLANEEKACFHTRYAVLAAQRNAKIIGIFTRLCLRDGKAHYLNYLPRVWRLFMNDLSHPALAPMRQFIETHVPANWRGAFTPDVSIGSVEV